MNIDDLRIILGSDQIPRRMMVMYKKGQTFFIDTEEHVNNQWIINTYPFMYTPSSIDEIINNLNIRRCRFFATLKMIVDDNIRVRIYSGIIE